MKARVKKVDKTIELKTTCLERRQNKPRSDIYKKILATVCEIYLRIGWQALNREKSKRNNQQHQASILTASCNEPSLSPLWASNSAKQR